MYKNPIVSVSNQLLKNKELYWGVKTKLENKSINQSKSKWKGNQVELKWTEIVSEEKNTFWHHIKNLHEVYCQLGVVIIDCSNIDENFVLQEKNVKKWKYFFESKTFLSWKERDSKQTDKIKNWLLKLKKKS